MLRIKKSVANLFFFSMICKLNAKIADLFLQSKDILLIIKNNNHKN